MGAHSVSFLRRYRWQWKSMDAVMYRAVAVDAGVDPLVGAFWITPFWFYVLKEIGMSGTED